MFFVVESGELSVEVHGEPVATIGAGAAFGEIALIDRRPRTATVVGVDRREGIRASRVRLQAVRRGASAASPGSCSSRWPTGSPSPNLVSAEQNPRARILLARRPLKASASRPRGSYIASARCRPSCSRSASAFARLARQADGLRAGERLDDTAAEDDAANAGRRAARGDDARCLPLGGRSVDLTLAGDHEVASAQPLVEADEVEHGGRACDELRSERGERGAEPAGRPRAGQVRRTARAPPSRRAVARAPRTSRASRPSAGRRGVRRRRASCARRRGPSSAPGARAATSRSPAPPSTVALPPSPTRSADGDSRSAGEISSPSPLLEATSGSRSARERGAGARSRRRPRRPRVRPAA